MAAPKPDTPAPITAQVLLFSVIINFAWPMAMAAKLIVFS
jgi:hypothetical protein